MRNMSALLSLHNFWIAENTDVTDNGHPSILSSQTKDPNKQSNSHPQHWMDVDKVVGKHFTISILTSNNTSPHPIYLQDETLTSMTFWCIKIPFRDWASNPLSSESWMETWPWW